MSNRSAKTRLAARPASPLPITTALDPLAAEAGVVMGATAPTVDDACSS